mmetsp:Transcript_16756/g.27090  ORF Transcript_16756/g.27090 Transcript_16756/m.27090 type:complete len:215 (+) Transcript_16756:467-1111(+)
MMADAAAENAPTSTDENDPCGSGSSTLEITDETTSVVVGGNEDDDGDGGDDDDDDGDDDDCRIVDRGVATTDDVAGRRTGENSSESGREGGEEEDDDDGVVIGVDRGGSGRVGGEVRGEATGKVTSSNATNSNDIIGDKTSKPSPSEIKGTKKTRDTSSYASLFVFFSLEKNEGACLTAFRFKKELKRNALGIALSLVFSLRVSKVNTILDFDT